MITEVEAYDGPRDRASHAHRGRTHRNRHMFGAAGVWYVYFTYGMHWLLNVTTGPVGYPAAVLIRGGVYRDPKTGRERRLNGPARLTKFLSVDGTLDGSPATRKSGLWIEDRGINIKRSSMIAKPRVGVDYAGLQWSEKPYNLSIRES